MRSELIRGIAVVYRLGGKSRMILNELGDGCLALDEVRRGTFYMQSEIDMIQVIYGRK